MSSILIVPVGSTAGLELTSVCPPLQEAFRCPVALRTGAPLDPQFAFDAFRNQYNSTNLLASLLEKFGDVPGKVIGITSHDLFVPVLTYVFGEAQLDGTAAIVSTHRLHEQFYGEEPNPALEHARIVKELIHEIGHTFGLIHCHDYECVMRSSTAVEEIDIKSGKFCGECGKQLAVISNQ